MRPDRSPVRAIRAACAGLLLAAACGAVPAAGAGADDAKVYTVAKLSVDVKAKDAVTAKDEALALAKLQALHTVFRRIAPFNSFHRLPPVKAETVDDLLEGFSVRKEKNSQTRYLATLDFHFNAEEVRKLLSEKGLSVADQQASPVTVLPVYIDKGKIDHTGRDPWRRGWNGLDLDHAVVPVRLARVGPWFDMETLSGVMGSDPQVFVALRDRLKAERLVLAVAEKSSDGTVLTTRLFGIDRVGSVSLSRDEAIMGNALNEASENAAEIALGILEGRWKLVRLPAGAGESDAPPQTLDVIVEFNGMGQWRDIRARLIKVPGLSGLNVKSLSARTAQVAFRFPGGGDRLAQALSPHGLALHGGEGSWVLRSN